MDSLGWHPGQGGNISRVSGARYKTEGLTSFGHGRPLGPFLSLCFLQE